MQTIYLDVLLVQNLYVNYFLLRAAAKLTHSRLRTARCLAAACGGSLFSLTILLPPLPTAVQLLCKLVSAAVIVSLAFGIRRNVWLRQFCTFFACCFLLAGLLLAICTQTPSGFSTWGNSVCYLDFSLLQLILFTALAYLLLHCAAIIRNRFRHTDDRFQIFLRLYGNTTVLPGLADTGNNLTDTFSGTPVIVCSEESLEPLLNGRAVETLRGFRLAPCATVTAQGILPLFRPDEVCIRSCSSEKSRRVDAMIGIGGTQKSAIFHPDLFY